MTTATALTATREQIDQVIDAFFAAGRSVGCERKIPAIPASSGFDPSVRFIGSHISVFLPQMTEARIPAGGAIMWQDCIRTRALVEMRESGRLESPWGSYFISLGALFPPGHEGQACALLRNCLAALGIRHGEVSFLNTDERLAELAHRNFPMWRMRGDPRERPYRHKVGVEHVRGENINIAVGAVLEPVANIIVYSCAGEPCGIEVALGTSTVAKVLHGLDHVIDAFPLPALDAFAPPPSVRCWKDAAVTALHLLREGLSPTGSHNRSRLLRRYVELFRASVVTRAMGMAPAREVLSLYLANQYASNHSLAPVRDDADVLDLLLCKSAIVGGGSTSDVNRPVKQRLPEHS